MSTEDEDIKFDRSLLGVEHEIGSFPVTTEMIVQFARSTGETNPLYLDEDSGRESEHGSIIAPPDFLQHVRDRGLPAGHQAGVRRGGPVRGPVYRVRRRG